MIQASTWYMLAETSGSARGDFLVSFGGYSVCVRAIVAYNSSSLYILSNNISANTLISFRIRKLVSKQYVDIKVNKELDIAYSIDNNNNWTALFGLSGVGQEICALNNINGDYSETGNVDYEDLLNKPSINGVTLIGDKKASDLNLQPAGDYADKQFETLFKKFFEYDEFHNAIKARLDFYTDTNKNISAGGYNNTGEIVVISSYSELKDKPFINGQELISGDNSLDKLGIQPKGNYTTNEFVESLTNAIIEKLNLHIKDFEDFIAKLNTYFEFDSEHQAIKVLLDLYTVTGKNISAGGYNNSGTEIIVPKSYNELTEKPQINGQELLSGNNTLDKLGIQPKGNYVTNEIVESQISAIIEKLNSHITDFETFVNELNTYFKFEPDKQAIKVLYDLYTDTGKNISAGGLGGSGSSSLGALYQLVDVMINSTGDGVEGAVEGSVLAYDNTAGKWKAIAQSEILPDMSGYYTKEETDAAINAIPIYSMAKLSVSDIASLSDGANVREAYRLKKGGNNVDDTVIKIYKDSAIKSLELRDNKYLVLIYTDNEGNEQSISKDLSVIVNDNYVDLINNQEIGGIKTFTEKTIFKKDINVLGDGIFGGEVVAIAGNAEPAGVTNYAQLQGKPSINGKELASGDNTLDALGIQPKGDYTTASQLASTLENYATKVFVSNNYATKAAVNAIQALIPATASADNQLADKDFVNSSIATATAEFRGSFTSLDELKATSGNLNDYAFYLHTDDVGNKVVDRYKWTTAGWLYEYTLNNSSFTAEQWAALNSAITATLVQSYNSHLNNTTIHITAAERTAWNNKWDYNEEIIKAVKVNAAVLSDKATKLATARKIWGKSFDGSGDVSGALTGVTSITATGRATLEGGITSKGLHDFIYNGEEFNFIPDSYSGAVLLNYRTTSSSFNGSIIEYRFLNGAGDAYSDIRCKNIYALGNTLQIGSTTLTWDGSALVVNKSTRFIADTYLSNWAYLRTYLTDGTVHTLIGVNNKDILYINDGTTVPTIINGGNVGIGTNTPQYKLDVFGTGHYSGDLVCGGEVVAVAGEGTPAGVTDYSALTGKPSINGVTLVSGNNTLASLGIQAAGDYATNSGVTTLLTNYADKTFVSNNYVGKSAFNAHTADTDIHITAAERNAWNAKWDYNEATIKAVKVTSASSADSVAWSGISGKPTNLSAFNNDVGFITGITKPMVEGVLTGDISSHTHSQYLTSALRPAKLFSRDNYTDGYYKIKINSPIEWMLSFDVKIYQNYHSYTIRFSGYNYNTRYWYRPVASLLDGDNTIDVKFGYDAVFELWVAIPASSYAGINITNVANGYRQVDTYALDQLFTITREAELSGTTQQTITLYPPSKSDHTHTFASLTSKPTTIAGYGITDAITTGNIDSQSVNYAKKSSVLVNSSTEQKFVIYVSESNKTFYIGDSIYQESQTHILGKEVRLRYGASATNGLILNTNGNVLIGTTTDNGYKLQVNGSERVYGDLIVDGEVSALVA